MEEGQVYTCKECGLELKVLHKCKECGTSADECGCGEEEPHCIFKCCGKDLELKA